MHLHSMMLQAIGPFAGRYTINFEELGASGIFLLEGPTGAGKSTLIDAIVFALYGKVASAEASEDRLRSGHAADDVESVVDLVLETGSGIYRVRRTPQFDRPKKRGDGTTRQQPSVKLWRLTSLPDGPVADHDELDGDIVSTRLDEAGDELRRAIGLDRTQFVQTIVLPQGEFASFLRADPEARSGLLQKIFGTQVYEQLQKKLEEMRREAARAVVESRADVGRAVAYFIGAASIRDNVTEETSAAVPVPVPVPVPGPATGSRTEEGDVEGGAGLRIVGVASQISDAAAHGDDDLLDLIDAQVGRLQEEVSAARAQDTVAQAARAVVQADLEAAVALASALNRRDALRAERVTLEAGAADHADQRGRLSAARRAAQLRPLLEGAARADAVAATADLAWQAAAEATPTDLVAALPAQRTASPGALVTADPTPLEAERDRCRAVVATLERVVLLEDGLPERRTSLDDLEEQSSTCEHHLASTEIELAAWPAQRREITDRQSTAAAVAVQLSARQERAETARAALASARAAVATRLEQATVAESRDVAVHVAREALAAENALRLARIEGMAGELAQSLTPDSPCPVCGSVEHPAPASVGVDHPDGSRIESAARARAEAETGLGHLTTVLAALDERYEAQVSAAGGLDVVAAEARVAEDLRLVAEAQAAGVVAAQAQHELDGLDDRGEAARDRAQSLRTAAATLSSRLDATRSALAEQAREVELARDGSPSVGARRQALQERADAIDALVLALRAVREARRAQDERHRELAAALREHRFSGADVARDALMDSDALDALELVVTGYEAALTRVTDSLAAAEVAGLPEGLEVDLDGARGRAVAAERLTIATGGALALATQRAGAATAARDETRTAVRRHAEIAASSAPVTRMADLAAGGGPDNARALSLQTYVLIRRFEDVVAAANDRLLLMSDGRFELVRSDEREDTRSRRTGLAMKVLDHRIESARDPRTLSGGETFYVSLCLALGMADVVTAEAGGIDLGTLFVDEGFGSLDPHTLDAVMAELGKLRSGGRVVGVVSHVEAMKQQIADRIEVRRLPDGSSGLTVRAG